MSEERRPPLEGIVVLDLSRVLAGPVATMVLADLGARVVKVEDPRGGDFSRGWKPPALDGEAAYFLSVNRRKESAAVDFGTEAGAEFVRRWAAKADVLVENFLPGALERRGLGVDSLRALNPRLVVCSISGAGDVGPEAGEPGFDLLAQGATGLMWITGPPDGGPHKVGVAVVDVLAGWSAVTVILGALHARGRDGRGAHVKTNLVSTGLAALVNVAGSALVTGREATRHGNSHATIEPYRAFEASDGGFLLAVGTDRQFETLCEDSPRAGGHREGRALLDECRARRQPERARPHPRVALRERTARGLARALQIRRNSCRARRRRARSDSLVSGDGAGFGPSDDPGRAERAHDPAAFLPRRLRRPRTRRPSAARRGHGEALRRGRTRSAFLSAGEEAPITPRQVARVRVRASTRRLRAVRDRGTAASWR